MIIFRDVFIRICIQPTVYLVKCNHLYIYAEKVNFCVKKYYVLVLRDLKMFGLLYNINESYWLERAGTANMQNAKIYAQNSCKHSENTHICLCFAFFKNI